MLQVGKYSIPDWDSWWTIQSDVACMMIRAAGGKHGRRPIIKSHFPACRPGPPSLGVARTWGSWDYGKQHSADTYRRESRGVSGTQRRVRLCSRAGWEAGGKHGSARGRLRSAGTGSREMMRAGAGSVAARPLPAGRPLNASSGEDTHIGSLVVAVAEGIAHLSRLAHSTLLRCMDPYCSHGSQPRFAPRAPETGPGGVGAGFGLFLQPIRNRHS